jgi:hypothetical protein
MLHNPSLSFFFLNRFLEEILLVRFFVFHAIARAICDFLRREGELMTELMNHKQSTL